MNPPQVYMCSLFAFKTSNFIISIGLLLLFICPVMSDSAIPWTAACQAFLFLSISRSFVQVHVHCISDAIQSSHPDALFIFCPQFFPASETYPVGQLFTSDDQNTGASASAWVLPMSIQGWLPLRLTGLISLLSKGLSGIALLFIHRIALLFFLLSITVHC